MRVKPIIKKAARTKPVGARPVTCPAISAKILNQIIATRNKEKYEAALDDGTHAYRDARSTWTAIATLITQIRKRRKCFVSFLDMAKAFDCVSRQALERALNRWNLPKTEANLVIAQYDNCNVFCHHSNPIHYIGIGQSDEETLILPDKLHAAPKHGHIEVLTVFTEGPSATSDQQYDSAQVVPHGRPVRPISDELEAYVSKTRNEVQESGVISTNYWVNLNNKTPAEAKVVRKPLGVPENQATSSTPVANEEFLMSRYNNLACFKDSNRPLAVPDRVVEAPELFDCFIIETQAGTPIPPPDVARY